MPNYGVGAIGVLVITMGVAVVVYGGGFLPLDIIGAVALVLGPLGVYTAIYPFIARRDKLFYLVWGLIMCAAALILALNRFVNAFVILGVSMIVIAVVGLVFYWKGYK